MNDHKILRALADGLTTSTEIAEYVSSTGEKLTEKQAQLALNRLLDNERVVRTKTATSYEWRIA